jgi:hypothetical protein
VRRFRHGREGNPASRSHHPAPRHLRALPAGTGAAGVAQWLKPRDYSSGRFAADCSAQLPNALVLASQSDINV